MPSIEEERKMSDSETLLLEIDIDSKECHLKLMDGSQWFVNPGDLSTIATWLPRANIKIQNTQDGTMFSYSLTNINDDISIRAMKIG
jgi:hypothetical protein